MEVAGHRAGCSRRLGGHDEPRGAVVELVAEAHLARVRARVGVRVRVRTRVRLRLRARVRLRLRLRLRVRVSPRAVLMLPTSSPRCTPLKALMKYLCVMV